MSALGDVQNHEKIPGEFLGNSLLLNLIPIFNILSFEECKANVQNWFSDTQNS